MRLVLLDRNMHGLRNKRRGTRSDELLALRSIQPGRSELEMVNHASPQPPDIDGAGGGVERGAEGRYAGPHVILYPSRDLLAVGRRLKSN